MQVQNIQTTNYTNQSFKSQGIKPKQVSKAVQTKTNLSRATVFFSATLSMFLAKCGILKAKSDSATPAKQGEEAVSAIETKGASAKSEKTVISTKVDSLGRIREEQFNNGTYKKYAYIDDFKNGHPHFCTRLIWNYNTIRFREATPDAYETHMSLKSLKFNISNEPMVIEEKLDNGIIKIYDCYIVTEKDNDGNEKYDEHYMCLSKEIHPDGYLCEYKYTYTFCEPIFGQFGMIEPVRWTPLIKIIAETHPNQTKTVKIFYDGNYDGNKLMAEKSPEGFIKAYYKSGKLKAEVWTEGQTSYLGYNRITYYENGNYKEMRKPNGDYIKYYADGKIQEEKNSEGTTYFPDGRVQ